MDSTLKGYIDAILKADIEYFLKNNSANNTSVAGIFILSYGGALLAFFLSVAGAYNTGATLISTLEADLFSWIDEYQGDANEEYSTLFEAIEAGDGDDILQFFLTLYGTDVIILTLVVFWHINFLIGMGTISALMCFWFADPSTGLSFIDALIPNYFGTDKMLINSTTGVADPPVAPIWKAWKIFLFGTLMGVINYLAGLAVSVNQEVILKLIGFTGSEGDTVTSTTTRQINNSGITDVTTNITESDDSVKNWFALKKLLDNWVIIFASQRILQIVLPYVYILILEMCVALTFSLSVVFMGNSPSSNPYA